MLPPARENAPQRTMGRIFDSMFEGKIMTKTFARQLSGFSLTAIVTAGLVACGGGGSTSSVSADSATNASTTADATPVAGTPTAALAGLSVDGTITGFGSVIIDGKEYDDTAASVAIDRNPAALTTATLGDLKLGMRVEAKIKDGKLGDIVSRAALLGPIASIDVATGRLVIFQQTVSTAAAGATPTVFEGVGGLASLAVGDVVEVHGTLDQGKAFSATRVERKPKGEIGNGVRVGGIVAALDANAKAFKLNDLTVNFGNATVASAAKTIAAGQTVFVFADQAPVNGIVAAKAIKIVSASEEGVAHAISGKVGEFASLSDFVVAGRHVDAAAAKFEVGTASDLAAGATAAFEATEVSGKLKATKVRVLKTPDDVSASLLGDASDFVNAASFKVRGHVVDASTATFTGATQADLGNGAHVEVRGRVQGDVFKADAVIFRKLPTEIEITLTGEARDVTTAKGTFRLNGSLARFDGNTQFAGGSAAAFAKSKRVEVVGKPDGDGVVKLTKVTFLNDELAPESRIIGGRISGAGKNGFKLPGIAVVLPSSFELVGGTAADLVDGANVLVKGTFNAQEKTFVASNLEIVKEVSREQEADHRGRSEGLVSDFKSKASFRVAGQIVDGSAAVFKDGSEANLANGKRVVVEGPIAGDPKVLKASVVRFLQ